ncbi:MAG: GerMN domain-containing protein [Spirochaetaceae bacterium]|nr:GerMN domain-containing protein [Spirochaetaceae bacterium]
MATSRKKKTGGWLLFWLAFFIGLALLFAVNLERIKTTLRETRLLDRLVQSTAEEPSVPEAGDPEEPEGEALVSSQEVSPPPAETAEHIPETAIPPQAPPQDRIADKKTVERPVYLLRVDTGGSILWTRVKRTLPASDSPLQDVLEALIAGPSAEEKKQGLISLIPLNVKLLNTIVRGNTAYINLSEDFLFNTNGVEGYIGQRRQVVLTATEFTNIKDVQILIDGKRLDYLGESIWIGSPIDRTML